VDKDKLIKIEEKLDKINDKLSELNVTLAENTQSLIIHEKRTDLAERKLDLLEIEMKDRAENSALAIEHLEKKIEPIHDHVIVVHAVLKYVLPFLITLLAFVYKFNIFKF
jgi:chromosome segregation ATPase